MKIPNDTLHDLQQDLSLARIVSEDSQPLLYLFDDGDKSSKDS